MEASKTENFTISIMSKDEVEIAMNWAAKEGWNPGIEDADTFYAADTTGFLVGKIDNAPIATISAVKYGASFGFVGLYIVKEEFRGKGYGLKIWQHAIDTLGGRNIGLDGVVAQQDNYKKSGFKLAHRNIRFAGKSRKSGEQESNIIDVNHINASEFIAYDRNFFPENREHFIKKWVNQQSGHSLAMVEGSKILGYGTIRACCNGFKVGPLNAEDDRVALSLFSALTNLIPDGSAVFLDVPEPNRKAVGLAQQNDMSPSFETARMYTGALPELSLDKVFGITTFELG